MKLPNDLNGQYGVRSRSFKTNIKDKCKLLHGFSHFVVIYKQAGSGPQNWDHSTLVVEFFQRQIRTHGNAIVECMLDLQVESSS